MLTERPRGLASRIRGKDSICRRLRALLIAIHRYGRVRARTRDDLEWAGHVIARLEAVLETAEGHGNDATQGTHP